MLTCADIINRFNVQETTSIYRNCYTNNITKDSLGGIIRQPSKVQSIKQAGIFDAYINSIWSYFRSHTFRVRIGVLGNWEGNVSGDTFSITCREGTYWQPGTVAKIYGKPSTTEVIEGAGHFAEGNEVDKSVQAMFCGAFNRGVIRDIDSTQDWSPTGSRYFAEGKPFNDDVRFFHQKDLSYEGYTYAFSYDDTFDQSSTCRTNKPDRVVIAIGGYCSRPNEEKEEEVKCVSKTFENMTIGNPNQPMAPRDLAYANIRELPYYFKWNSKCEADSFNIYVNGIKVGNTTGDGFDIPSKYFEKRGNYAVSVTALLNGVESEEAMINWNSSN